MIIFNISGGLGNQFFQYAFGRYLVQKHKTDLFLNFSSYEEDRSRRSVLDYFKTNYRLANESDIIFYKNQYAKLHPFLKKYYRMPGLVKWKRYFNDVLAQGFHPHIKNAQNGYFHGYWANEKYFIEIKQTLLHEFSLKEEFFISEYKKLETEINQVNSVMVHIRRGDYLANPAFSRIFNVLSKEYYIQAIDKIVKAVVDPVFYFFSDDPDWVEEELLGNANFSFQIIKDQLEGKDYLEFSLMRNFKHFIIANSTFSWWAAWLSENDDKIVIAPKKWYVDNTRQMLYEQESFLPDTWNRI